MPSTHRDIRFREVQRMASGWRTLCAGLALGAWLAGGYMLWLGLSGAAPFEPLLIAIIILIGGIIVPMVTIFAALKTEVRDDTLHVMWWPLKRRTHTLDEIESAVAVTYRPLLEYGGWGIRWSPLSGWAYNISGNRGVRLRFKNGQRLLIGSKHPEALVSALGLPALS